MKFNKICLKCNEEYICYYEKSKYCSQKCRNEAEGLSKKECPNCFKSFQPSWHGQIHCDIKCYAKSESLRENSKNSLLIKYNGVAKWREGTESKPFKNSGQFKKGLKPWNYKRDREFADLSKKIRRMKKYLDWKTKVLERDAETKTKLHVHHLKPFRSIIVKNKITSIEDAELCNELWDLSNGVTLTPGEHQIIFLLERMNSNTKGFFKAINYIFQSRDKTKVKNKIVVKYEEFEEKYGKT